MLGVFSEEIEVESANFYRFNLSESNAGDRDESAASDRSPVWRDIVNDDVSDLDGGVRSVGTQLGEPGSDRKSVV